MLTASQARFLTYAVGVSNRFVDFAVDAFEACRKASSTNRSPLAKLWHKHFADTGFETRPNEFEEVAAEILLSRSVDSFHYYLADVFGWALWRRPEAAGLKRLAEQLASELQIDLDDAVAQVASSHAEKMSFGGFDKLLKSIEITFGVHFEHDAKVHDRLRHIIAVRNMIAHNHARKNARYCKTLGEPPENVGQSVRPNLVFAREAADDLARFVALVDKTLGLELLPR